MIPRYTLPEIAKIWSDENKFSIWLEIEILAVEALAELGWFPKEIPHKIRKLARFDVNRINEIEKVTKHDVIAFLTDVEESIGELAQYLHYGMTSSDVLDTCLAVQCQQAGKLILEKLHQLSIVLKKRAIEFKNTPCIGRSHGVHAEPITFGLKFALWFDECQRNIKRLENAIEEISYGKISGAVGTYEHIPQFVEEYVCKKLNLKPSPISTQVIQRDRHAFYISTLGLIASMLEKIATEIRHLQRTEVLEAEEYFSQGQKGSSAMPHKRNPITSENICGQARLIRSFIIPAIENNTLWHERDISHSSVERIILPDATISLYYILTKAIELVDKLIVYPENMKKNLELTSGLIYSQKVLLSLMRKGMKRQEAYKIVQTCSLEAWENKKDFKEVLQGNQEILKFLSFEEIEHLFSFEEIFQNVDIIFKRLGIE
ncbi:adenylosuccinate lyase [Bacteroidetes/Chlorobi group bacterium Naka2016]|jgi:adenylosuccinate lyase|nr:MAG: adenylosuccinate lyase [Bacteroidetes/Chlorobi group bacterium Naka2016]